MTALPARDHRDEPMTLAEFRAWHPAGEGRWSPCGAATVSS